MPNTLVKFSASWCQPCKQLQATLDGLMPQFPDLTIEHVDIEEDPKRATEAGVRSVPVLSLNGTTLVGNHPPAKVAAWIAEHLS